MRVRIHRVDGLMASSFVLEGESLYLVDAGYVGHGRAVARAIRRIGRSPEEIGAAIVTHGHLDHFGGLAELRDMADFPILTHPDCAHIVRDGGKTFSPGRTLWTRQVARLAETSLPYLRYRGAGPVTGVGDGETLHHLGIPGRVFHTPGHTHACVSFVLDDGTAFTGDLVTTRGHGRLPALPSMAVSHTHALRSWHRLLSSGVRHLMPSHGSGCTSRELAEAAAGAELVDAA